MRTVAASEIFAASAQEAEALWYDTSRWSAWVPGLERVEEVSGGWPGSGARVSWQSVPAGRGRVVERVLAYEPLAGQTVEVEDDSIRGQQTVAFDPEDDHVVVVLSLSYRLKQRSPLMPVVDLLFIRGAMRRALEQMLSHFGVELEASRRPEVG